VPLIRRTDKSRALPTSQWLPVTESVGRRDKTASIFEEALCLLGAGPTGMLERSASAAEGREQRPARRG